MKGDNRAKTATNPYRPILRARLISKIKREWNPYKSAGRRGDSVTAASPIGTLNATYIAGIRRGEHVFLVADFAVTHWGVVPKTGRFGTDPAGIAGRDRIRGWPQITLHDCGSRRG